MVIRITEDSSDIRGLLPERKLVQQRISRGLNWKSLANTSRLFEGVGVYKYAFQESESKAHCQT